MLAFLKGESRKTKINLLLRSLSWGAWLPVRSPLHARSDGPQADGEDTDGGDRKHEWGGRDGEREREEGGEENGSDNEAAR